MDVLNFRNKTVVVTGAAQGIGRATAVLFARRGARVAIVDVDEKGGRRTEEMIRAAGGTAAFFAADLADPAAIRAVAEAIVRWQAPLHVLVNNAGVGFSGTFADLPLAAWDRILSVNLRAPYRLSQALYPHFAEGAAIVNIASTRALMSEPNTEPYSASKGGILALTHALAVTLGPRTRVNAVSPGWIDTSAWVDAPDPKAAPTEADHAWHPIGRVGRPEDVAYAVLFLASEEAGFITGVNLIVDGGMTRKMVYL